MLKCGGLAFILAVFSISAEGQSSSRWQLSAQLLPVQTFSVQNVTTLFQNALETNDQGHTELITGRYIEAYSELARVFDLFGVVFYFAREDIMGKLTTLSSLHIRGQNHYRTFQRMFAYENSRRASTFEKPGITVNRWMQRALLFILRIIGELEQPDTRGDLSNRVRQQYEVCLAPHHTWAVRTAVRLALNFFPSRDNFLSQVNLRDDDTAVESLHQLRQALSDVYNHVQDLYDNYQN